MHALLSSNALEGGKNAECMLSVLAVFCKEIKL
jgi:hypothetical protein